METFQSEFPQPEDSELKDSSSDVVNDYKEVENTVDVKLGTKEFKNNGKENSLENGQGLSAAKLNNGVDMAFKVDKQPFAAQEGEEDSYIGITGDTNGIHGSVELTKDNEEINEVSLEKNNAQITMEDEKNLGCLETVKMGSDEKLGGELCKESEKRTVLDLMETSALTTSIEEKPDNAIHLGGRLKQKVHSEESHEHTLHSGGDTGHTTIHSGGNHKFVDNESKAEYMKIKSEVTGEAETSESEDDSETAAQDESPHHGSHSSPDAKTKAEYRKIKYEVTGEALTSESEDENISEDVKEVAESKEKDTTSCNEWVDILGNGLLKKRILRAGKGRDTRPERGQIVMLRTAGRLEDGTAVDWNQGFEFTLGEGEVIQAFDIGVALIELSEVCELVTDARYAYGEQGRIDSDSTIPPNAKITYEIELLAVRDGPDIETMSDEERMKIGDKKKELGNDLYIRGDYSAAINCYQRAIKYLTPSTGEKVQNLKLKCWNNLAAAQLKVKAHTAALTSCMHVLNVSPDNVKALFRKGKVLAAQGDLEQAITCVKRAVHLEPTNKTIRSELTSLKHLLSTQNQQEKDMCERMVGALGGKEEKSQSSIVQWSLVFGAAVVVIGGIVAALYLNKHTS